MPYRTYNCLMLRWIPIYEVVYDFNVLILQWYFFQRCWTLVLRCPMLWPFTIPRYHLFFATPTIRHPSSPLGVQLIWYRAYLTIPSKAIYDMKTMQIVLCQYLMMGTPWSSLFQLNIFISYSIFPHKGRLTHMTLCLKSFKPHPWSSLKATRDKNFYRSMITCTTYSKPSHE